MLSGNLWVFTNRLSLFLRQKFKWGEGLISIFFTEGRSTGRKTKFVRSDLDKPGEYPLTEEKFVWTRLVILKGGIRNIRNMLDIHRQIKHHMKEIEYLRQKRLD